MRPQIATGSAFGGAHSDMASVKPLDFYCRLAVLIVEARQPAIGPTGRQEGVHCQMMWPTPKRSGGSSEPIPAAVQSPPQRHKCDPFSSECSLYTSLMDGMKFHWHRRIAVNLVVILRPDGCPKFYEDEPVRTITRPVCTSSVVLERWSLHVQPRSYDGERILEGPYLVHALRSHLHFSQLSAWLSEFGGKWPKNIDYRIVSPSDGEYDDVISDVSHTQYTRHDFPPVLLNDNLFVRVTVQSKPRDFKPMQPFICGCLGTVRHQVSDNAALVGSSSASSIGFDIDHQPIEMRHRRFTNDSDSTDSTCDDADYPRHTIGLPKQHQEQFTICPTSSIQTSKMTTGQKELIQARDAGLISKGTTQMPHNRQAGTVNFTGSATGFATPVKLVDRRVANKLDDVVEGICSMPPPGLGNRYMGSVSPYTPATSSLSSSVVGSNLSPELDSPSQLIASLLEIRESGDKSGTGGDRSTMTTDVEIGEFIPASPLECMLASPVSSSEDETSYTVVDGGPERSLGSSTSAGVAISSGNRLWSFDGSGSRSRYGTDTLFHPIVLPGKQDVVPPDMYYRENPLFSAVGRGGRYQLNQLSQLTSWTDRISVSDDIKDPVTSFQSACKFFVAESSSDSDDQESEVDDDLTVTADVPNEPDDDASNCQTAFKMHNQDVIDEHVIQAANVQQSASCGALLKPKYGQMMFQRPQQLKFAERSRRRRTEVVMARRGLTNDNNLLNAGTIINTTMTTKPKAQSTPASPMMNDSSDDVTVHTAYQNRHHQHAQHNSQDLGSPITVFQKARRVLNFDENYKHGANSNDTIPTRTTTTAPTPDTMTSSCDEGLVTSVAASSSLRHNQTAANFCSGVRSSFDSSPAPLKRNQHSFDFDSSLNNVKNLKHILAKHQAQHIADHESNSSDSEGGTPLCKSAPVSSHLLGNFEESALNGRIKPNGLVEGFSIDLAASGAFCPAHVRLPLQAFYFDVSDDKAPSPFLGRCSLEPIGRKGYHVPRKGTIQVTLFNPHETVVKMFLVRYDLNEMPVRSQTFYRQRTYYMPSDADVDQLQLYKQQQWLRYLIHLRFATSRSGKLYLHTDIRMLFSRKSELDRDGVLMGNINFENKCRISPQKISEHPSRNVDRRRATTNDLRVPGVVNAAGFELRSFTECPKDPRYSPRKLTISTHNSDCL